MFTLEKSANGKFNRNNKLDSNEVRAVFNVNTQTYGPLALNDNSTQPVTLYKPFFLDINGNGTEDKGEPKAVGSGDKRFLDFNGDSRDDLLILIDFEPSRLADGSFELKMMEASADEKTVIYSPNPWSVDKILNLSHITKSESGTNVTYLVVDFNGNGVIDANEPTKKAGTNDPFTVKDGAAYPGSTYEIPFIDLNGNGVRDVDEPQVKSANNVKFLDLNRNEIKDSFEPIEQDGKFVLQEGTNLNGKTYLNFNGSNAANGNFVFTTDQWDFTKPFTLKKSGDILFFDKNGNGSYDIYGGELVFGALDINKNLVLDANDSFTLLDGSDPFIDLNGNGTKDAGDPQAITLGADRFLDLNGNGVKDSSEPIAIDGKFTLPETSLTFLDYNFNEALDRIQDQSGALTEYDEYKIVVQSNGSRFLDVKRDDVSSNGKLDPGEPSALSNDNQLRFTQGAIVTQLGSISNPNGVFIDLNGNKQQNKGEPFIRFTIDEYGRSVRYIDLNGDDQLNTINLKTEAGQDALERDVQSIFIEPFSYQNNSFNTELLYKNAQGQTQSFGNAKVITYTDDYGRLTMSELWNLLRSKDRSLKELVQYDLSGVAQLGLKTKTSIGGSSMAPALNFDINLNYPIFNYGNSTEVDKNGLSAQLDNIQLDLGSWLTNTIKPMFKNFDTVLAPIRPILRFFNSDTYIFNYLGVTSTYDTDGDKKVSVLEMLNAFIPVVYAGDTVKQQKAKEQLQTVIKYSKMLNQVTEMIDLLNKTPDNQSFVLDFGSYSLTDVKASNPTSTPATPATPATPQDLVGKSQATSTPTTSPKDQASTSTTYGSIIQKLGLMEGLELPILTDTSRLVQLLFTGEGAGTAPIDLVKWTVPALDFNFDISKSFPIYPGVSLDIGGGIGVQSNLQLGFDSYGMQQWKKTDFDGDKFYLPFDGLYINDWDSTGKEKNELTVTAKVTAGVTLNALVASVEGSGGIKGTLGLDLKDVGEEAGTNDGKVRFSEIYSKLSSAPSATDGLSSLFQLSGKVTAFLNARVTVAGAEVYGKELPLKSFDLFGLPPKTGNSTKGKGVDSYIAGAEVFLESVFDGEPEAGSPTAVTDINGKFFVTVDAEAFKLLDKNENGIIDNTEARLVLRGGVDTLTGEAFSGRLYAPFGATAITPVTTLLHLIASKGNITEASAANLIAQRLSLDLSLSNNRLPVDLATFDPISTIGNSLKALKPFFQTYQAQLTGFTLPQVVNTIRTSPSTFSSTSAADLTQIDQQVTTLYLAAQIFRLGIQIQSLAELGRPWNSNVQAALDLVATKLIALDQQNTSISLTSINDLEKLLNLPLITNGGTYSTEVPLKVITEFMTQIQGVPLSFDTIIAAMTQAVKAQSWVPTASNDVRNALEGRGIDATAQKYEASDFPTYYATQTITNVLPPSGQDKLINIQKNSSYTFTLADFGYQDSDGNPFTLVSIDEGSIFGTLTVAGKDIGTGDVVRIEDIADGKFMFTPIHNGYGSGYDNISFSVNDGTFYADTPNIFTINVADNNAPTSLSLSNTTINENITANTIIGLFSTADADIGNTFI